MYRVGGLWPGLPHLPLTLQESSRGLFTWQYNSFSSKRVEAQSKSTFRATDGLPLDTSLGQNKSRDQAQRQRNTAKVAGTSFPSATGITLKTGELGSLCQNHDRCPPPLSLAPTTRAATHMPPKRALGNLVQETSPDRPEKKNDLTPGIPQDKDLADKLRAKTTSTLTASF